MSSLASRNVETPATWIGSALMCAIQRVRVISKAQERAGRPKARQVAGEARRRRPPGRDRRAPNTRATRLRVEGATSAGSLAGAGIRDTLIARERGPSTRGSPRPARQIERHDARTRGRQPSRRRADSTRHLRPQPRRGTPPICQGAGREYLPPSTRRGPLTRREAARGDSAVGTGSLGDLEDGDIRIGARDCGQRRRGACYRVRSHGNRPPSGCAGAGPRGADHPQGYPGDPTYRTRG